MSVVPAKAGIQPIVKLVNYERLDLGLRRDDGVIIDPAIKHVEQISILSFPRVGGGPSSIAELQKIGSPPTRGKGVLQHI